REGKYIFKKSLEPSLPHDILYRSKMGFSIPLSKWFKNELKPVFEDTVLSTTSLSAQYLNIATVKQIWQEHQAGNRERSPELWSILFFEKWLRKWLVF
ncbi:MAG: asparagine synthetase B, partial [Candidatus Heimdallarchaeota archaeon]|nr:asparagine synthetase B [Candidatus Heimdallarchaeota archaeon]